MATVAFHTLGCKVNLHDTEGVASLFRRRGYTVVDFDGPADVYVINTCSVTNTGTKKSRQVIRKAVNANPRSIVVAMGCYVQYAPDEVAAIPGVDVIVGTHGRGEIVDMVEDVRRTGRPVHAVEKIFKVKEFEELPALDFEGKTRATLKIQDGCNEFCAFCQIPWARGRNRSRSPERVVEQVEYLAAEGFKEVVLTGVHLGTYGIDLDPPVSLAEIIRRIHDVKGLERIRISSIDPHEIDDDLIDVVSSLPKVCRHFHIPAQAGDDDILLLMRRRNSVDEFRKVVDLLRARIADLAITTDIIVGFPQETDERFENTYAFCQEMAFSKIHVFPYSVRTGTAAARIPGHVDQDVKRARVDRLIALSDQLSGRFHRSLVGQSAPVLVERLDGEWSEGLTDTYVRARVRCRAERGQIIPVIVTEADASGVIAAAAQTAGPAQTFECGTGSI